MAEALRELHYSGVDWVEVMDRLTAYVYKLHLTAGLLRDQPLTGLGKSPEDYVQTVLTRLLDPRDGAVAWDEARGKPTTEGVFAYLRQVVLHDFVDDRKERSHHRRTRALEMPSTRDGSTTLSADPPDPRQASVDDLLGKVHRDRLYTALLEQAAGDEKLEEYLWVQYGADGYIGYPPRRAAELLRTTVDDINNRKKRCAGLLARALDAQGVAGSASGRTDREGDDRE